MSLSTNTTYRVYVDKLGASNSSEFIGDAGELFYDPNVPTLKLSDGSTPGGLTIAGGGGGGGSGESYWVSGVSGISTSSSVGIGTTNPQYKLHVIGDARITGILTVGNASVTIDGNNNTLGVGSSITIDGSSGVIYSNIFVGDGSGLVGIVTDAVGTEIYEDGAARGTATCLNFGNGFNVDPVSSSCANINIGLDDNSNFVVGGGSGGNFNNFLGQSAGQYNTFGDYNNFLGMSAGVSNTSGSYNNFLGQYSGRYNTTGRDNNFIGRGAGYNNTLGENNNFFGCGAGYYNSNGCYNNFFGYGTGCYNESGCNNNFFGQGAGCTNISGSHNNFLGYYAGGLSNITGSYNNFFGYGVGISTSASNKILIGRGSTYPNYFDSPDTTKDTQLAIGVRTDANPSKYWLVGNENFNVGIGTTNPTSKLTVGGDVKVGFNTSQGVILTSPNGTQYRLVVNNSGVLSTVAV